MPLNKSQITSKINTDLPTNGTNEISAEDLRNVLIELNTASANLITDEQLLGLGQWNNSRAYSSGKAVIKDNIIYQCTVSVSTVGTFELSEWQQISSYIASTSGLTSYLLKDNGIELENGKLLTAITTDTAISNLNTGFYKVEANTVSVGLNEEYPELGKGTLVVLKRPTQAESLLYYYPHNNLTKFYIKKANGTWNEIKSGSTYTAGDGLTLSSNELSLGGEFETVVLTGDDNSTSEFVIGNSNAISLTANTVGITGNTIVSGNTSIIGDINIGTAISNIQTSGTDLGLNGEVYINDSLLVRGGTTLSNPASYTTDPYTISIDDNQIPNWKKVSDYVDTKLTNEILDSEYVNGLFGVSGTNGTGELVNSVGLGGTPLYQDTTIETIGNDFKINNNTTDSNFKVADYNISITAKNGSSSNVKTVQTNAYNNYKVEVFNSSNIVVNKIELDSVNTKLKGTPYLLDTTTATVDANTKMLAIDSATKKVFYTTIPTGGGTLEGLEYDEEGRVIGILNSTDETIINWSSTAGKVAIKPETIFVADKEDGSPIAEFKMNYGEGTGIYGPPWNNLRTYHIGTGTYANPESFAHFSQSANYNHLACRSENDENYAILWVKAGVGNTGVVINTNGDGFGINTNGGYTGYIKADNITVDTTYQLPTVSGTLLVASTSGSMIADTLTSAPFVSQGSFSPVGTAHFPGTYNNILSSVDNSNQWIYTHQMHNSNFIYQVANYNVDNLGVATDTEYGITYSSFNYLGYNISVWDGTSSYDFSFDKNALKVNTDIEVSTIGKGLILKSPDNTRWRITVSDAGEISATAV